MYLHTWLASVTPVKVKYRLSKWWCIILNEMIMHVKMYTRNKWFIKIPLILLISYDPRITIIWHHKVVTQTWNHFEMVIRQERVILTYMVQNNIAKDVHGYSYTVHALNTKFLNIYLIFIMWNNFVLLNMRVKYQWISIPEYCLMYQIERLECVCF